MTIDGCESNAVIFQPASQQVRGPSTELVLGPRPFPKSHSWISAFTSKRLGECGPFCHGTSPVAYPSLFLPALGLDVKSVSVSGVSSGGYMAAPFEVAHARVIMGTAIVAAGPVGIRWAPPPRASGCRTARGCLGPCLAAGLHCPPWMRSAAHARAAACVPDRP